MSDKIIDITKGEAILTKIDNPLLTKQGEEIMKNFTSSVIPNLNLDYTNHMVEQIKNIEIKNPNEKVEELLTENNQIGNEQKDYLKRITYENMKLNAQIDTLNKQIDTQNTELEQLRTSNAKLEVVNNTLIENNKHYWRNTFLIGVAVAIISFVIGFLV